jgi:hypothetical protein
MASDGGAVPIPGVTTGGTGSHFAVSSACHSCARIPSEKEMAKRFKNNFFIVGNFLIV